AASLALQDRPPAARLLLVVDQFEEVFTLCRDEEARRAFLATLLHAASVPEGRVVVLLTMRADFYHRCGAYPELAQELASRQYLVSPLTQDGLRQAIAEPARRVAPGSGSSRAWWRRSWTTSAASPARCRSWSTRCSSCGSAAAAGCSPSPATRRPAVCRARWPTAPTSWSARSTTRAATRCAA